MIFTEMVVTSSAIYAGSEVYKKRKKEKKLVNCLTRNKVNQNGHLEASSLYNETVTSLKRLKDDVIEPIVDETQIQVVSLSLEIKEVTLALRKRSKLAPIFGNEGHETFKYSEIELRRKFVISGASLVLSAIGDLYFPVLSLITLPGIIYIFKEVFESSYHSITKEKRVNVDTMIGVLAIILVFRGYFFLCQLNLFMYVCNRILVSKIKQDSKATVIDVFSQQPNSVTVLMDDGAEIDLSFKALKEGDIVIADAGKPIPVDGHILEGNASVDQRILTGEAQPVEKAKGDPVFASTVVLSGKIQVRVEKHGDQTTAAQIGQILSQTVDFKMGMQLSAEKIADNLVIPTLILGGIAIPIVGIANAMGFLNSHPRHKMTIATSISILNFFKLASESGILIKDGRTIEFLGTIDTVVFDKTGTLTEEQPHVRKIYANNGYLQTDILRYAAAAEHKQTHPIARAILQAAEEQDLSLPKIDDADYKIGYGLTVIIEGKCVQVGSTRFIRLEGLEIPEHLLQAQDESHELGHSLVLIALDREVMGAIELRPTVRPEASRIIKELRAQNIKETYIISGDHETPTRKLANELGIDYYFAETLPENKADLIEQLQNEGKSVCFVGDGINDSIALKKANVSISLRGASTIAIDTAQVVLMDESLNQLSRLFELSSEFDSNVRSTFAGIAIPCAFSGFGIFFLGFGIVSSVIITQIGLYTGILNAMVPLIRHRAKERTVPALCNGNANGHGPLPEYTESQEQVEVIM